MKDDAMNPPDYDPAALRALLETLPRPQGETACPAAEELIGWLEGTLPAERAATVEAALAQQPDLRRALAAARLGHEEAVPPAELAALDRLVIEPVVPLPRPASPSARAALWMAAAAAAVLVMPAWRIGSGIAERRQEREDRELRQFLNPGLMKGGL